MALALGVNGIVLGRVAHAPPAKIAAPIDATHNSWTRSAHQGWRCVSSCLRQSPQDLAREQRNLLGLRHHGSQRLADVDAFGEIRKDWEGKVSEGVLSSCPQGGRGGCAGRARRVVKVLVVGWVDGVMRGCGTCSLAFNPRRLWIKRLHLAIPAGLHHSTGSTFGAAHRTKAVLRGRAEHFGDLAPAVVLEQCLQRQFRTCHLAEGRLGGAELPATLGGLLFLARPRLRQRFLRSVELDYRAPAQGGVCA